MDPTTYPVLNRWPTPEELVEGSVWEWWSEDWAPRGANGPVVVNVEVKDGLVLRVGHPDDWVWDASDWTDGDTIQRIR